MDFFNKIISFILGLVVVIVFISVITKKVNLYPAFRMPATLQCEDYKDLDLGNLPVRCLRYYLNK